MGEARVVSEAVWKVRLEWGVKTTYSGQLLVAVGRDPMTNTIHCSLLQLRMNAKRPGGGS